jgi:hypothetical protein
VRTTAANMPMTSRCKIDSIDDARGATAPSPTNAGGPVMADLNFLLGLSLPPGESGANSGSPGPWGWPGLADLSCWSTERLMSGAVPVSCTGLRYSHSATLAGGLKVDKWSRRSCPSESTGDGPGDNRYYIATYRKCQCLLESFRVWAEYNLMLYRRP